MSARNEQPQQLAEVVQKGISSRAELEASKQAILSENVTLEPGLNVLLVEDDPDDIFLVREALAAGGFGGRIMMSIDGQEAVEYLLGAGPYSDRSFFPIPDLVLLDLNLPKRNGFEVLQLLRKHPTLRRIPIVILTTSSSQADIDLAYEMGASGYLLKPGNFSTFLEGLKRVCMLWLSDFRRPSLN